MSDLKRSEINVKSVTAIAGFDTICAALQNGDIAAIPTETVYGLAADSRNDAAVAKIYTAKGRPSFNPLIVHVENIERAKSLVVWNDKAEMLAQRFWPGPLTMVLKAKPDNGISKTVSAGLDSLAIRCPAHPVMQTILAHTGLCLAAPSANRSGGLSPTSANHVRNSFAPNEPLIIDGGDCSHGVESSIIALRDGGWQILRPGTITSDMIANCLGETALEATSDKIEAPGQLSSHYAPRKKLRLNATSANKDEYHIGFADMLCDDNLSPSADLKEAARNLFAALHRADLSQAQSIAVAPIAFTGIGIAINDRLQRAAAA